MIDLQAQPQLKHLVINLGPTFFTSFKNRELWETCKRPGKF